jgi:hypothetical protein
LVCATTTEKDVWTHIVYQKSGTDYSIFQNGIECVYSSTSLNGTNASVNNTFDVYVGSYEHTSYDYGPGTGKSVINSVRLSDVARYTNNFSSGLLSLDSDTLGLWTLNSQNEFIDGTVHQNDGTVNSATALSTCPEEDLDGDGVAAWEDCDDGDASVSDEQDCRGCETVVQGSIYYFCSDQLNWNDAGQSCTKMGGDLLTINDSSEWSFVNSTLNTYGGNPYGSGSWGFPSNPPWIGLNDIDSNGTYVWSSGETGYQTPYGSGPWQNGEPGGSSSENCMDFNYDNGQGYRDDDCTKEIEYICEVPLDADGDGVYGREDCNDDDVTVADEATDDCDGDGFSPLTGDCNEADASIYPFAGDTYGDGIDSDCDGLDCEASSDGSTYFAACPEFETQSSAKARCMNAGYDGLAEVHSSAENSFLLNLIQWSTGYHYWLGLENSGSWTWVSGTPVTYTDWAPSEPNNTGTCTMLWGPNGNPYTNKWNDVWCSNTQDGPQGIGAACEKR